MSKTSFQVEQKTKQRLLEAAGEVFAERGFQAATVKDICARAEANIAAVNYHFRDKSSLYSAVLDYAMQQSREKAPIEVMTTTAGNPAERLRAYTRAFMRSLFDTGRPAWLGKLMVREMADPTQAFESLIDSAIRPNVKVLKALIREFTGPELPEIEIDRCAASITGQCLYYYHSRAVVERVYPSLAYTPESMERIAGHIAEFTRLALDGLRAKMPVDTQQ